MKISNFRTTNPRNQLLGLAIAQAIGGFYAPPTRAGTINAGNRVTVGSTSDLQGDILCSLRDAVEAVKSGNTVGGCSPTFTVGIDRIDFDPAITPATISLLQSPLMIDSPVSIQGPGRDQLTLRKSGNASAVIENAAGNSLRLSNFTIADGRYSCLVNETLGRLTLADMVIRDCSAVDGAGIHNSGILEINESTLTLNTATAGGGAIFNDVASIVNIRNTEILSNVAETFGGGIFNAGYLDIEGGIVELNRASEGGGVDTSRAYGVTISGTILRSNSADNGGALLTRDNGLVTLSSVTLSANIAFSGAAIDVQGGEVEVSKSTISNHETGARFLSVAENTRLSLNDSLISENSSSSGAIYVCGDLELSNTTISNNSVQSQSNSGTIISSSCLSNLTVESNTITGNTSGSQGSAVRVGLFTTLQASNNIIAGHNAYDCIAATSSTIAVNSNNIFQTGSCSQNAVNNIIADPELGPLADNGGPTLTHALLPTSPAINTGNSNCGPSDQRGFARSDGLCDIGAFEFNGTSPDVVFGDGFEN